MLPATRRLKRADFTLFHSTQTVTAFNKLGTVKYIPGKPCFSVVTSKKHQKSAVLRNRFRRQIYNIFTGYEKKNGIISYSLVLYPSKQAYEFPFRTLSEYVVDLFKKTTK